MESCKEASKRSLELELKVVFWNFFIDPECRMPPKGMGTCVSSGQTPPSLPAPSKEGNQVTCGGTDGAPALPGTAGDSEGGSTKSCAESSGPVEDPYMQSMSPKEATAVEALRARLFIAGADSKNIETKAVAAGQDEIHCLLRFTRARKRNVKRAEKMIRRAMAFHKEMDLPRIISSYRRHPIIETYAPGMPSGIPDWSRDLQGAPVYWERSGKVDPRIFELVPNMEDWMLSEALKMETFLSVLRKTSTPNRPQRGMVAVADVKGFGMALALNKNMQKIMKPITYMMDHYYPELLKRIIVINAPGPFKVFWQVVRVFLDENTRNKVVISSGSDIVFKYIDPKNVPGYIPGGLRADGDDKSCSRWVRGEVSLPEKLPTKIMDDIAKWNEEKQNPGFFVPPKGWEKWTSKACDKGADWA